MKKYLILVSTVVLLLLLFFPIRQYFLAKQTKDRFPKIFIDIFQNEATIVPPFAMPKIAQPIFPNRTCAITDYGAIADGKTKNTVAISNAISDCAAQGGGIVLVSAGTWFTGPIHLESGINLHLEKGSTLIFSTDLTDYLPVVFSRYEGIENYSYSPLIYAKDSENIAITGEGMLNGQGQAWTDLNDTRITRSLYDMGDRNTPVKERVFGDPSHLLRPTFIELINCSAILLEGFSIGSGPFWTIHPVYSSDIIVRNISVLTNGKNNDGIDLDSSKNILVENSHFETNDDAIVIKSGKGQDGLRINRPTENVVIRHTAIENGHGAIAIGSEIAGGARNIFAYDVQSNGSQYGVRIKTLSNEIGLAENMWFQNITVTRTSFNAVQLTMLYDNVSVEENPGDLKTHFPTIHNIHFTGLAGTKNKNSVNIDGLPNSPISNISFQESALSGTYGSTVTNAANITFDHFNGTIDKREVFIVKNSENISIEHALCRETAEAICFSISGAKTKNIRLQDNDFFSREALIIGKDVPQNAITY